MLYLLYILNISFISFMAASNNVGFIGLGIMGKGMLKNLVNKLDSSTHFFVWNRSPQVCEETVALYPGKITISSTPADVVRMCQITYSMLSTPEASASVFDDLENGVIAGVSEGKIIVDCATLSPERIIQEATMISAKGGKLLEAPVSGSKVPAETGTLIFLCGGDEDIYNLCSPALDAMGKAKFYFGAAGQGSRVKLVVNMIMGSVMAGFAEGLALAKSQDLSQETLLQVLDLGAMSNPMFKGKGASILKNEYSTNFPLKHQQKDMRLALEIAARNGLPLPTATASNEQFLQAIEENLGDEDFCAIYKTIEAAKK